MTNDRERWDLGSGFNPWGIIGEGGSYPSKPVFFFEGGGGI